MYGIVVEISLKTKQVLDYEILSKKSLACSRHGRKLIKIAMLSTMWGSLPAMERVLPDMEAVGGNSKLEVHCHDF